MHDDSLDLKKNYAQELTDHCHDGSKQKGWVESIARSLAQLTSATATRRTRSGSEESNCRAVKEWPAGRPADGERHAEPPWQMRLGGGLYRDRETSGAAADGAMDTVQKERGQVPLRAWALGSSSARTNYRASTGGGAAPRVDAFVFTGGGRAVAGTLTFRCACEGPRATKILLPHDIPILSRSGSKEVYQISGSVLMGH